MGYPVAQNFHGIAARNASPVSSLSADGQDTMPDLDRGHLSEEPHAKKRRVPGTATATKTGLTVRGELDTGQYPSGIVVSDAEMAAINIKRAEFHGDWNYTISPDTRPP
jgi:Rhodopirellula transposase DDE domain